MKRKTKKKAAEKKTKKPTRKRAAKKTPRRRIKKPPELSCCPLDDSVLHVEGEPCPVCDAARLGPALAIEPVDVRPMVQSPPVEVRFTAAERAAGVDWRPGVRIHRPGIYYGVPAEVYRDLAAVNNSSIGPIARSPAHYREALRRPPPGREVFRLGNFLHAGALEPLSLLQRYAVLPDLASDLRRADGTPYDNPRGTAEFRRRVAEFRRVNRDKQIVDRPWLDALLGVAAGLKRNARARDLLTGPDVRFEVVVVWNDRETDLLCKARLDALDLPARRLADLKSTADAGDDAFCRSIADYGYDRQAAFYADAIEALCGDPVQAWIVAAEKEAPFAVRAAPVADATLATGRRKYRRALRTIAACRQADAWPTYPDPAAWELPRYLIDDTPEPLEPDPRSPNPF